MDHSHPGTGITKAKAARVEKNRCHNLQQNPSEGSMTIRRMHSELSHIHRIVWTQPGQPLVCVHPKQKVIWNTHNKAEQPGCFA
ncbi:hypothetical protein SAMN05444008_10797 [Cnuella takakiae]|uniref:Uncharacterized protein n=1 Tax=Cnuella takakiae TaxID=1302690 RepID=A0A1M5B1K2_9BACT|nr:hypothetical protein SAMN05444008_10797 [Cnuella takakiae]